MEGVDATVWNGCLANCQSRCPLRLQVKDGTIVRVLPDNTGDDTLLNRNIKACVRGRNMRQRVYNPDRIKKPLKRVDGAKRTEGRFEEISWDEALDLVATRFKEIIAQHGPDAVAGVSCARSLNEDSYQMQKLFRAVFKTNNIDHCART